MNFPRFERFQGEIEFRENAFTVVREVRFRAISAHPYPKILFNVDD